ncbi:MAG: DNA-binding protein [Elusimicrobiota bacterium]|nr:DNA-binding protein [Elusimicrobiota bacterium]
MRNVIWAAALLAAAGTMGAGMPGRGAMRGHGGWGPGGDYSRRFDAKTVETVSGEVLAVKKVAPLRGMGKGVHLTLKSEKETLAVHLGPSWYLDNQEFELAKGDKVEVKGSRIEFDGKPALIAVSVVKGDLTLTLRDEEGFPLWSGWRRRR